MTNVNSRRSLLLSSAAFVAAPTITGCAIQRSTTRKAHFVLIHGSWHGAWCWNKVIHLLRAGGHAVTAVDLPGRWQNPRTMTRITAADYVDVVGQVILTSEQPVVLVGHSLGGATVSLTAEKYSANIRRSIYLSAFMLVDGETVGSVASRDKESLISRAVIRDTATNTSTVNPALARDVFYQDCTDDDVRMAVQLMSPESGAMLTAAMRLTPQKYGTVDRAYIECLNDRAISIGIQRAMQAASPCENIVTLNASHSPFLSQPAAVADALVRLGH